MWLSCGSCALTFRRLGKKKQIAATDKHNHPDTKNKDLTLTEFLLHYPCSGTTLNTSSLLFVVKATKHFPR
jgi:hypothetical protein